jgi:hypothetical protein
MKFGSPEDMRKDAILTMKRYLPTPDEKWIDSIEDQSVDDKGIKFELKIGRDTIHMYKVGKWSMQWEFYFNKKKIDPYDIRTELEGKHLSKLDAFIKYGMGFDFYADYIDNGRQYQAAQANNDAVLKMYKELSPADQAKAKKELYKKFDKQRVDLYFN